MVDLKTVAFISAVAVFSLVLLTSVAMPSMVAAQNNQDEAAERLTKNKQYLGEANVLFAKQSEESRKIAEYEKAKENASSEQEKQELERKIQASEEKWNELQQQIREIEKLNQALFVVKPELEKKLYSIEKDLIEKYLDHTSESYVGENPVETVGVKKLTRSIYIVVNPEEVAPDGSNLPTEKSIDGIPVEIRYGKIELASCDPHTWDGVCRPIWGGVSAAEQNTLSLNTIGYKAVRSGATGFVMAGHSAVGEGKVIVQPHDDSTKRVGVVPTGLPSAICRDASSAYNCDFAFVDADSGIGVENKIFVSPLETVRTVTSKTNDSGQTEGTFVHKSGAGGGHTTGQITENSPNFNYNRADFSAENGDSGAPVWTTPSASTANLFGIMTAIDTSVFPNEALYFPQDWIELNINAEASTS
ncbi:MAG: hypothetical protein HRF40_09195 [Nitrososphaera sp.]|jgi:hypothetical protein